MGLNNDKDPWMKGMPVFQVVVQEKEQHPLVLGSASAHSVINAPVPGAQAEPPGTERFLHTQAPTHPITTGIITASALGGRNNCENKT